MLSRKFQQFGQQVCPALRKALGHPVSGPVSGLLRAVLAYNPAVRDFLAFMLQDPYQRALVFVARFMPAGRALARAPPGGRAGEQLSLGGAMDTGLTSLALGSRATLAARAIAANTKLGTEMMGLSPEQRFLVDARIDQDTLVTVYNAELSAAGQLPRLHLDNHAGWIAHSKPTHGAVFQLKELCAGLGGFSQKANFVGIKTVACLDHSRLACDALRRQGHQVVHAQMEDMEALFKIGSAAIGRLSMHLEGLLVFAIRGPHPGMCAQCPTQCGRAEPPRAVCQLTKMASTSCHP